MIELEDIYKQCLSDGSKERTQALKQLETFLSLPNKQQEWNVLYKLANNKNWDVRYKVAYLLGSVFSQLPDKQQAWEDLLVLVSDEDGDVRNEATSALVFVFPQLPDKQQSWEHLIRLTSDKDWRVRDKATSALGSAFSEVLDKQQAWNDLHGLTIDNYYDVRSNAASVLGVAFPEVPDKQQAWEDLHRLINDKDSDVRLKAAFALGSTFLEVPDKQQAWKDLIELTKDKDGRVRYDAPSIIIAVFSQVQNIELAWGDLIRLTKDKAEDVRDKVASALGSLLCYLPDKQQGWKDLIKLTNDKEGLVWYRVVSSLDVAFFQVPDKQLAWNDLHGLINNEYYWIRYKVAHILGSVFSQVPDKQQAWDDLIKLTHDKDSLVRVYANHSLGRVSIFEASQAGTDEDYKKELEKAIEFFEIASKVASTETQDYVEINPSKFCLPIYRSFHTIIFKKQETKEEVDRYLAEAKSAIEGSRSKKSFFEAIENLANALKETQSLDYLSLKTKKGELDFYRIYCDRAVELMKDTEEKAPFATIAMRKGLPILDRNLKGLLEEIRKKAKITCKESKGTTTEEIACTVNREVQRWEIGSHDEMIQKVEDIAYLLKMKVADLPENKYLLNKIEAMKHERNLVKQYDALLFVIGQIPTMKVVSEKELDQRLDQKLQKFDLIFDEITYIKDKLSCISFDISKIKLNSADVISNLKTMKEELEILCKIEELNTLSIEKLGSIQAEKLDGLNNDILERLSDIKILIHELSKDNDELYKEYSRRLDELKQSKLDTFLQRYSTAISLISFAISGIQIAR